MVTVITDIKQPEEIDEFISNMQKKQIDSLIEATITPHSWRSGADRYVYSYFIKLVFKQGEK